MRENLLSIKEAFEVLGTLDKSVGERAEHIHSLKDELQRLLASLKDVQTQGNRLTEEVKHELSSIEGYSDSMEFVKAALEKFPSQKDILKRMEELEAHEKSLQTKLASLEGGASAATLPQISIDELLELKQELDEKRKQIAEEVQELFSAVEQESATYSTFQKIKEKAVESLDSYDKTVAKLNGQMDALDTQIAKARKSIDSEMQRMKGSVDDNALAELINSARAVEEKKAVLDDVAESLEALSTASENITKKLNLLAREAEILSIRTSGPSEGGSGGGRVQIQPGYKKEAAPESAPRTQGEASGAKEDEVRQQLYLTKGEQVEFDRKREELRQLIKKLWEQDN
jgi:chromosome segregation ATPase